LGWHFSTSIGTSQGSPGAPSASAPSSTAFTEVARAAVHREVLPCHHNLGVFWMITHILSYYYIYLYIYTLHIHIHIHINISIYIYIHIYIYYIIYIYWIYTSMEYSEKTWKNSLVTVKQTTTVLAPKTTSARFSCPLKGGQCRKMPTLVAWSLA
jgi:hypothetical protein